MFDNRCLALTVVRNTAIPHLAKIQHIPNCGCPKKQPKQLGCPCGVPYQHKGMCRDALREADGRDVPVWKP